MSKPPKPVAKPQAKSSPKPAAIATPAAAPEIAAEGETAAVEIHRPKPWHGWREFLKEYGIIVLGVLTALAAEQVADNLRKDHEAREANQRIRAEISRTMAYAQERLGIADCVDGRLVAVQAVLHDDKPLPNLPRLLGPPQRPYIATEWGSAVQAGFHQRFTRLERDLFPVMASSATRAAVIQDSEGQHWAVLATLTNHPRTLDPSTRESLLQTLALARLDNRMMASMARQFLASAKQLGVKPLTRDPDGTPAIATEQVRATLCAAWPSAASR